MNKYKRWEVIKDREIQKLDQGQCFQFLFDRIQLKRIYSCEFEDESINR